MAKYKSRHKGSEIDNAVDKVESLATVATTGSYNDLTDKPDIPSGGGGADITVDESLSTTSTNPVQNKVITAELNKKGTYSKPSDGIPKSDLASDVQTSLDKADTALQSFEEQYKGTVTSVKINGSTKNPDADGLVDLGNIVGDGEGGSVIVDEALSDTSTNPVQNKAIAKALNQKFDKTGGVFQGFVCFGGQDAYSENTTGSFRIGKFDENGGLKLQFGADSKTQFQILDRRWTKGLFTVDTSGNVTAIKFIGALEGTATNADMLDNLNASDFVRTDRYPQVSGNNWDMPNGIYNTDHDTKGLPYPNAGNHVIHCNWDTNAANQLFLAYDKDIFAFRRKYWNVWQPWRTIAFVDNNTLSPASGTLIIDGSIKANDYLDAYGISLYETFATKTELGDINAVLDAINGEVI